jgi:hypothetical protein
MVDPTQASEDAARKVGDPRARDTAWTPLEPGGTNFATAFLEETSSGFKFRKNAALIVVSLVLLVVGVLLFTGKFRNEAFGHDLQWIDVVFGVLAFAVSGALLVPPRITVDTRQRQLSVRGRVLAFDDVLALQLLSEHLRDSDGDTFTSVELNLVMKDSSRLNLVDHGDRRRVREDAARLAFATGWKVWDAS